MSPSMSDERRAAHGQAAFAAALFDADAPPPADLSPVAGAAPVKRFAVYRNNVVSSLIRALATAYPTIRKLVGDAFFDAAAALFVRAHPPDTPVMAEYGGAFPEWIAAFPPARSAPYLGDVAALEWAMRRAYHAADAPPLDQAGFQARVAGLDPNALARLTLPTHPAAVVVASVHPIFEIWAETTGRRARDPGGAPPRGAQTVLVTRPRFDLELTPAPLGTSEFFSALAAGAQLGAAAEAGSSEAGAQRRAFALEDALKICLGAGAFVRGDRAI